MKGKGGKHKNEGFHGKRKGKDEVSFGRRGKRKMVVATVFFLGNQQDF